MADALADIKAFNRVRGPGCETGIFLEQHPDLAAIVTEALDDPTIQTKAVSRWLADTHHIKLGYWSLGRHARGDCSCE